MEAAEDPGPRSGQVELNLVPVPVGKPRPAERLCEPSAGIAVHIDAYVLDAPDERGLPDLQLQLRKSRSTGPPGAAASPAAFTHRTNKAAWYHDPRSPARALLPAPGRARRLENDMSRWVPVAEAGDLPPGEFRLVEVDDLELALFNVDGRLCCIEDLCTHDGGNLVEGDFDGRIVTCPRHGAKFDVHRGGLSVFRVASPPPRAVRAKIE
jgi:3-phenylpropionate/trans-cinnamate dioxygenase ferredoxin subunit